MSVDVVVVGAGVSGLTTAMCLLEAGRVGVRADGRRTDGDHVRHCRRDDRPGGGRCG